MKRLAQSGFTLIELLVAITLAMVLTGAGLAAYRGIGEKQTLKQAGISLQTNLRALQQKALAGEKPSGCSGTLGGYRVSKVSVSSYKVVAECSTANGAETSFSLPTGVSFDDTVPLNFETEIFFPVLRSDLEGAQDIVLASESFQYQVIIEASGVIRGEWL